MFLIRDKYCSKMGLEGKRIWDFKADILADAEIFMAGSEVKPDISLLQVTQKDRRYWIMYKMNA